MESELEEVVVVQGDETWHEGAGWYFYWAEYPDEGSVGAFDSREEAEAYARSLIEEADRG